MGGSPPHPLKVSTPPWRLGGMGGTPPHPVKTVGSGGRRGQRKSIHWVLRPLRPRPLGYTQHACLKMSSTLAGVLRLAAESTEDCSGGPLGHHGLTVPCPNSPQTSPYCLHKGNNLPTLVTSVTEKDVVAGACLLGNNQIAYSKGSAPAFISVAPRTYWHNAKQR